MQSYQASRKRDRSTGDTTGLPAPVIKKTTTIEGGVEAAPSQPDLLSDTIDEMLSNPVDIYAGPSILSSEREPSPAASQESSCQPSSPPESGVFIPTSVALPLKVTGDIALPAGPVRVMKHRKDYEGNLDCAELHPEPDAVLVFENPRYINSLVFEDHLSISGTAAEVRQLQEFLKFLRKRMSSCAVCQLTNKPSEHHLTTCKKAARLGTFVWQSTFNSRDSNAFEQAILVLAALLRLVASHHLTDIAIYLGENIPSNYLDYKEWCLQPAVFCGCKALKAHIVLFALKVMAEDGVIEL
ncbi:hypothetical protein TWF730_000008 [Orbilia blumenaviensis]|uniref:Uncharacterized protein n=1 Tax=Orbilia blumenaviensis TaxID=1796055 RepID=A0AAV9VMG0_9PEZI